MNKKAILLCNLGSPDHPNVPSVRRYLNQFLMDPSVIQLPWLIRRIIVSLFVLPKRPKASAHAYQQVWMKDGSPLVVLSKKLREAVQKQVKHPVYMAMRYGNPSIESQVLRIAEDQSIKEIFFIPLYPHYAESTVKTCILETQRVIKKHRLNLKLIIKESFYDEPGYINALVNSSSIHLFEGQVSKNENIDSPHLLFSYHGLPELHLTKIDHTKNHCLKKKGCCEIKSEAHKTCYRHQVLETTRLFVEKTGLKNDQYTVAFQSRLGRAKWLEPSTETKLKELAEQGVKNIIVLCPAFVTDCLETLEEIAIRGNEVFQDAGGQSLKLVPCLNNYPDWVSLVASWCNDEDLDTQKVSNIKGEING
ncbi:MAG: ferrochelatase [Polaribacter sp.]|jgi:ferrochelatase